jgi:hypothetical protein
MPIEREDGFLVSRGLTGVPCLGLESSRLPECIEEVHRRAFRGAFGSCHYGFHASSLDSLTALPPLEQFWLSEVPLTNLDGLLEHPSLRFLRIGPKRPPISFEQLPALEELVLTPVRADHGLAQLLALRTLHLWHLNPKNRSLAELEWPTDLVELQLNWANVPSLDGLPTFPNLTRLELHRCRNLVSLEDLPRIAPHLVHLVVGASGRVTKPEPRRLLEHLPRLQHAFVHDTVLISEGAVAA